MQQKWEQEMVAWGTKQKRIKVAATINWKGTMPPLGKMCGNKINKDMGQILQKQEHAKIKQSANLCNKEL